MLRNQPKWNDKLQILAATRISNKKQKNNLWTKKLEADKQKEVKREERYANAYALDKERLELQKQRIAVEKERLDNEAANTFLKTIVEEQKIMNMDISSMTELQKEYFISLQAEIVARRKI